MSDQPFQGDPAYQGQPMNPKAQKAAEKAYRKAQRPWYSKKRFIIPMIFVALAILGSLLPGSGTETATPADTPAASAPPAAPAPAEPAPAEPAPAEPAPAEPAPAEPAATVVSAQEMIAVLEGNALNAKNTYEGKRVTVSGFVGSIDASGDYFALDPEPEAIIFTGIQVQTSKKFLDQVAGLSAGQPVTVTGTVTDVGEVLGYSLKAETIG